MTDATSAISKGKCGYKENVGHELFNANMHG